MPEQLESTIKDSVTPIAAPAPQSMSVNYDPAQLTNKSPEQLNPSSTSAPYLPPTAKPTSLESIDQLSQVKLLDAKGKEISVPFNDSVRMINEGKASFLPNTILGLVDKDGKAVGLDQQYLGQALQQGYRLETPSEKAIRLHLDSTDNVGDTVDVANKSILDEMGFGDLVGKKGQDNLLSPLTGNGYQRDSRLQQQLDEATKNQHSTASLIGKGVGMVGSVYANPIFEGASAAGTLVEKGLAQKAIQLGTEEAVKAAAPGLLRTIGVTGLKYATESAIIGAPHALSKLANGDESGAAEGMAIDLGIGFTLGAAGKAGSLAYEAGSKALSSGMRIGSEKLSGYLAEQSSKLKGSGLADDLNNSLQSLEDKGIVPSIEKLKQEGITEAGIKHLYDEGLDKGKAEAESKLIDATAHLDTLIESAPAPQDLKIDPSRMVSQFEQQGLLNNVEKNPFNKKLAALINDMKDSAPISFDEANQLRTKLQEATKLTDFVSPEMNAQRKSILGAFNDEINKSVEKVGEVFPNAMQTGNLDALLKGENVAPHSQYLDAANNLNNINNIKSFGGLNFKALSPQLDALQTSWKTNLISSAAKGAVGGAAIGGVAGILPGAAYGVRRNVLNLAKNVAGKKALQWSIEKGILGKVVDNFGNVVKEKSLSAVDSKLADIGARLAAGPSEHSFVHNMTLQAGNAFGAFLGRSTGSKEKDFEDLRAELNKSQITGSADLPEKLNPITKGNDQLTAAYLAQAQKIHDYLYKAMPVSPPVNPLRGANQKQKLPNDADMAKFGKVVGIVHNPFSVIDKVADGSLTAGEVQTLKDLYPLTHQAIVQQITQTMAAPNHKISLNYPSRIKLGLLMGETIDPSTSPDAVAAFQSSFDSEDEGKDTGGGQLEINGADLQTSVQKLQNS